MRLFDRLVVAWSSMISQCRKKWALNLQRKMPYIYVRRHSLAIADLYFAAFIWVDWIIIILADYWLHCTPPIMIKYYSWHGERTLIANTQCLVTRRYTIKLLNTHSGRVSLSHLPSLKPSLEASSRAVRPSALLIVRSDPHSSSHWTQSGWLPNTA